MVDTEIVAYVDMAQEQTDAILIDSEEFGLLCKIVWCEARGEGVEGQAMVAEVILNRVASGIFPDTVKDVIYQEKQFSPVSNGQLERASPDEDTITAVQIALDGAAGSDGALYFRSAAGAEGSWHDNNLSYLFVLGNHIFYK